MSTHTNPEKNINDFRNLFNQRSEKKEIEHDSFMLMAAFLSEIEAIQEEKDISRKELAKNIHTSASYLTQVFRSKKPLNFLTLAKIKRALKLSFEIKVSQHEDVKANNTLQSSVGAKIVPFATYGTYINSQLMNIEKTVVAQSEFGELADVKMR
ncbi:MAG: helix-turn-helix transcriptional regulator [Chitinophagaceae bacterium]